MGLNAILKASVLFCLALALQRIAGTSVTNAGWLVNTIVVFTCFRLDHAEGTAEPDDGTLH